MCNNYLRRKLSIWMTVPLPCEKIELLLGEVWINHSQRDTMESTVPSGKERVFPRVWHRQNIVAVHMSPLRVSDSFPVRRRRWLSRVAISPLIPYEQIMLLAPHHARESLPLNVAQVV